VIEFERSLPGDGTRPYTVTVADIIDLEPVDDERARVCVSGSAAKS
jgi:hypothetical protein